MIYRRNNEVLCNLSSEKKQNHLSIAEGRLLYRQETPVAQGNHSDSTAVLGIASQGLCLG